MTKYAAILQTGVLFFASGLAKADVNLTTSTSPSPLSAPALGGTSTLAAYSTGFVQWVDSQSTGSGVIDSFVRIEKNGTEQGFNSTTQNLDIGNSNTFNHFIQVSDVGSVNLGGTNYLQFLLDINQQGSRPLLSLDDVEIFTSAGPDATSTTLAALSAGKTKVFQSTGTVYLDYSLNPGSGAGDMYLYVPRNAFGASTNYIYLYSHFGGSGAAPFATNAGFEEWATIRAVPEPGFFVMLSLGFGGLGLVKYRKRRGGAASKS